MGTDLDLGEPVDWLDRDGVRWAYRDGLVIVLVANRSLLERAVSVMDQILSDERQERQGTSGELVIDGTQDWSVNGVRGAFVNFDGLAAKHRLSERRIGLLVSEEPDLEAVGQRRFLQHCKALKWATAVVGDRFHPKH
ncbi:hypothetical protein [Burkholderia cepacia]|uniref:hypothetical protein n=1 Tax=Burkholderia cepacia TaxID=292 RepID=UPI003EE024E4